MYPGLALVTVGLGYLTAFQIRIRRLIIIHWQIQMEGHQFLSIPPIKCFTDWVFCLKIRFRLYLLFRKIILISYVGTSKKRFVVEYCD